ncbi:crossover junction endodeoxyribonuclease RuvC [Rickettsiales bacterium]|nr:crossover junction endodeoxyribonuclease RuvC [Rickettsiales bacterium]
MTRIIGIDPGLNKTGWGIIDFDGQELVCVDYGVVTTSSKKPLAYRLQFIHNKITDYCHKYQPSEAAIEETFVNQNPRSSLLLGCARGALMLTFALLGIKVEQYSTNLIKEAISGDGHADKQEVMRMVICLLGLAEKIASLDASDALAAAIYHTASMSNYSAC